MRLGQARLTSLSSAGFSRFGSGVGSMAATDNGCIKVSSAASPSLAAIRERAFANSRRLEPTSGPFPAPCEGRARESRAGSFMRGRSRFSDSREPARLARRSGLTLLRGKFSLAPPDVVRRHLYAFVVADELKRLLERQQAGRNQPHELVRSRRTHVRELLLLRRIHVQVLR